MPDEGDKSPKRQTRMSIFYTKLVHEQKKKMGCLIQPAFAAIRHTRQSWMDVEEAESNKANGSKAEAEATQHSKPPTPRMPTLQASEHQFQPEFVMGRYIGESRRSVSPRPHDAPNLPRDARYPASVRLSISTSCPIDNRSSHPAKMTFSYQLASAQVKSVG